MNACACNKNLEHEPFKVVESTVVSDHETQQGGGGAIELHQWQYVWLRTHRRTSKPHAATIRHHRRHGLLTESSGSPLPELEPADTPDRVSSPPTASGTPACPCLQGCAGWAQAGHKRHITVTGTPRRPSQPQRDPGSASGIMMGLRLRLKPLAPTPRPARVMLRWDMCGQRAQV
jgi:hypothetical protein